MPRSARSCFAALLLVLLLVPAAVQADDAPRATEPRQSSSPGRTAWAILARVWNFVTGSASKNGCAVEISGVCLAPEPTPTLDNGCEFDPSGRCYV